MNNWYYSWHKSLPSGSPCRRSSVGQSCHLLRNSLLFSIQHNHKEHLKATISFMGLRDYRKCVVDTGRQALPETPAQAEAEPQPDALEVATAVVQH